MGEIEKRYLLHINLSGKPTASRIKLVAAQVQELVSNLSPDHQLAYTSGDGGTFGFFLKSNLWAKQIANYVYSPPVPSPLSNEDSLIVVEIGKDFSEIGRAKSGTWLKYHRPQTSSALKSQVVSDEATEQSQLTAQLAKIKDKLGK